jgi:hypothetical protein
MKTVISATLAIVVGFILGKFILNQYHSDYDIKPVFNETDGSIYFLKQGEYETLELMEESMLEFENYIFENKENKYITYVGITADYENMIKLQGFFANHGYSIYIEEINIDEPVFLDVLSQYDQMLRETEDSLVIKTLTGEVLKKYEELVVNIVTN